MPAIERFVREDDVKPTCECANRKCGPHRCWPSIWMGGLLLASLVYVLYLHSVQIGERAELRGVFATEVRDQAKAEAALTTQDIISQWDHKVQARLASVKDDFTHQLHAIPPLLERAERLTWALATPAIERDVQLKQAVEALQQRE